MLGFGVTLVLLAVFIRLETVADHPMLDISLFRDRRFSAAATAVTISTFALFGFIFLITQYFQFVRDYTALGTGTRILPVAAAIAGSSILGGFLAPRVGVKTVVTVGMAMLGGAFVLDLDDGRRRVVRRRDRAADAADGHRARPHQHPGHRVDHAGAAVRRAPVSGRRSTTPPASSAAPSASRSSGRCSPRCTPRGWSSTLDGRLPADQLAAAEESVGVADAIGAQVAGVTAAMEDAFMTGLGTASLVIGLLCLAGAVFSLVALPGNRFVPPAAKDAAEETGLSDREAVTLSR